jgi:hypothetical protein
MKEYLNGEISPQMFFEACCKNAEKAATASVEDAASSVDVDGALSVLALERGRNGKVFKVAGTEVPKVGQCSTKPGANIIIL